VGQAIPATITLLQNGTPDAHALVTMGTSAGRLSRTSGRTNSLGQIHVTITRAPAGQLAITATAGRARSQATVRVVRQPFPWWTIPALLGLVLLGVVLVVGTIRQRLKGGKKTKE